MTFGEPLALRLGAVFGLLILLGLWSHTRRRRQLADFLGGRRAAARVSRSDLYRAPLERMVLLLLAAVAISLAAADPAWIAPPPPPAAPPVPPRQVMLALDISASMQAADVEPTRLARATTVARELIAARPDDRIGLLLFAGETYPLAPPTQDHTVLSYLLDGVSPTIASAHDPGSLLSAGIIGSSEMFDARSDSLPNGERAVILIGDGEAGETETAVLAAASAATEDGITVHTVGIGTVTGSGIVMPAAQYQLGGQLLDAGGNPVVTRFREPILRRVAEAGGGVYAAADDPIQMLELADALATPAPAVAPEATELPPLWARYDLTFLFTAAALACLLLESLLDVRIPRRAPARIRRTA